LRFTLVDFVLYICFAFFLSGVHESWCNGVNEGRHSLHVDWNLAGEYV